MDDAIWTPEPSWMKGRWWQKFELQPNGCKLWTGCVDEAGYGRSKGNGPAKGEVYVHRIVYKLLVGPIPPRAVAELDHECHNRDTSCREKGNTCLHRRCGEAEHLVLKAHAGNLAAKIKTHCKYGHEKVRNRSGKLVCRVCAVEGQQRFKARIENGEIPVPDYLKPTGRPIGRPKRVF